MQTVKKEFDNAKEIVEECLREDPRCRNSDLWLMIQVWQKKQGIKIFVPYDMLEEMISPETIRRVRQKIQNEKRMYLPTDHEVLIKRRIREKEIRNYMVGRL